MNRDEAMTLGAKMYPGLFVTAPLEPVVLGPDISVWSVRFWRDSEHVRFGNVGRDDPALFVHYIDVEAPPAPPSGPSGYRYNKDRKDLLPKGLPLGGVKCPFRPFRPGPANVRPKYTAEREVYDAYAELHTDLDVVVGTFNDDPTLWLVRVYRPSPTAGPIGLQHMEVLHAYLVPKQRP